MKLLILLMVTLCAALLLWGGFLAGFWEIFS
jgi:hypothetical protein